MFVGKKIEVQLFGGTINVRNVPLGSPFFEVIMLIKKFTIRLHLL